jgi:hypothetical protein
MYHLHRQFGDMIKVIISEPGEEQRHGTFDMYKKRPDFPLGIPAWKVRSRYRYMGTTS